MCVDEHPGSSKWRFAALPFVHSQDIREIRGPNAFKTRLKCIRHEIALSVTRQTCTWNCRWTCPRHWIWHLLDLSCTKLWGRQVLRTRICRSPVIGSEPRREFAGAQWSVQRSKILTNLLKLTALLILSGPNPERRKLTNWFSEVPPR